MFLLVLLLPLVARRCLGSEELNTTEVYTGPVAETTEYLAGDVAAGNDTVREGPASPRPAPPRLSRRRPRRSRRFRPGSNPRYRDDGPPYNPAAYNPYYRVPHTYYDAYYNPYQGYYPEYAQPGYYPAYPYQPQQPYPQPYPHPPPPPVVPTPPPTLAPIPDLYYVQNTDGHYQYRRVSVTRRPQWPQYPQDRRYGSDYRQPRRPGRLPAEFRPPRLTSAPHKARVFGLSPDPPPSHPTEASGG